MGKSFVHQENPVVTGIETYTEEVPSFRILFCRGL